MKNSPSLTIRKCALPIELVHKKRSEKVVIGIHGFTGYPGELALPASKLYEAGFDVFIPRLPGHGTSGDDFVKTRKKHWIEEIDDQINLVKTQYQKVSLIGHSMGGAIALILAQKHAIETMVLYAPALSLPSLPVNKIFIARFFVKKITKEWAADPSVPFFDTRDEDDDLYLGSEYWSYVYPKQLYELEKIRKEALSLLTQTRADILVFTGGADDVVDSSSGRWIIEMGKGKNNWIHLENASHLIPYDPDTKSREQAMKATLSWLNS